MKHLLLYENYTNDFFILYGELIYILSKDIYGTEYRITYLKEGNTKKHYYIGSDKDIREDFILTDRKFNPIIKPSNNQNISINKKDTEKINRPNNSNNRYNLVYYNKNKKIETIIYNIDIKKARGLRKWYSEDPKYKLGNIKIELNN